MRRLAFLLGFVALSAGCTSTPAPAPTTQPQPALLIPADKIYTAPDAPVQINGMVLIRDGRILSVADERSRIAIPEGTQTSDCRGVVVAGFQNSHVHLIEPRFRDAAQLPAADLEQGLTEMLSRWGVTTAFDITSDQQNTLALRKRLDSGEIRGPRILTTGLGLFPVDGIPIYIKDLPADMLARMHQPRDAAEATRDVRANLAAGADGTKVFLVTPVSRTQLGTLTLDVARAAADETHRHGKILFAHPTTVAGLRTGLDAGVDVFAHTTVGDHESWDAALIQRMVKQNVSVIPTFKLWYYELAKENVPASVADGLVAETLDQLRAFKAGGGNILFGTDVGYMHDYDPTDEYTLMAKAGLTPMEILASLTTAPAARLNETAQRGRVQPGLAADLVVLGGDPADDVRNFANVRCVFRKGELIYSAGAR
jgi:imidazolonepropionase-like amidohydrolase